MGRVAWSVLALVWCALGGAVLVASKVSPLYAWTVAVVWFLGALLAGQATHEKAWGAGRGIAAGLLVGPVLALLYAGAMPDRGPPVATQAPTGDRSRRAVAAPPPPAG